MSGSYCMCKIFFFWLFPPVLPFILLFKFERASFSLPFFCFCYVQVITHTHTHIGCDFRHSHQELCIKKKSKSFFFLYHHLKYTPVISSMSTCIHAQCVIKIFRRVIYVNIKLLNKWGLTKKERKSRVWQIRSSLIRFIFQ
jgi:hypothetical protein